jgi:hypothetical protein
MEADLRNAQVEELKARAALWRAIEALVKRFAAEIAKGSPLQPPSSTRSTPGRP